MIASGRDTQRSGGEPGIDVRRLVAVQAGGGNQGAERCEPEASCAASAYHSPLNYTPKVAKDRRLIITGLGDRLAPP